MAQTYCDRDDLVDLLGEAAVVASMDDDGDGVLDTAEESRIDQLIERGAVEMNSHLRHQYRLTDVASNAWCKWANVHLTAYYMRTRRNNQPEQSIVDAYNDIRVMLIEIHYGRQQLPEQNPSFDHTATVSNFRPEIGKVDNPIRVDEQESTGLNPVGNRKRNPANQPGTV